MKFKITTFLMAIVLLFSLLAVSGSSGTEEGKKIVIAYSNNVEGYLEPCG